MIGFVMNRDRPAVQLGIIICTRNRPKFLENLLKSISESMVLPKQIVLVSSGIDIKEVVSIHSKNLNLKHIHTEKIGQSNQKVIGISSLDKEIDWIFFLDDDLMLKPNTISKALHVINRINDTKVGGIGARILPIQAKLPSKIFDQKYTNMKKIGGITKSGRATKYMFDKQIQTEWLNGAAIWRVNNLKYYDLPILNSRYAAYEDVNFSSSVAKHAYLLYDPTIEVIEQIDHSQAIINFSQFKYITLWTGFLVCNLDATTILRFKILTLIRSVLLVRTALRPKDRISLNLKSLFVFVFKILKLSPTKSEARKAIVALIDRETSTS
jgi:glycosyltransferase involved in cell wall biosynthesis